VSDVPDLCVIVLSYRNETTLPAALDSLAGQGEPLEILVSHSGGPWPRFERPGSVIRVVASEERRTPGAARNAGVAASRAPFVAFLAGDCRALPGWAAGRLRRHRAGAVAVASAMTTPNGSPVAVASHLLQHSYRMTHLTMPDRLRFGLSYSRETLDRFGPVPESLAGEEDAWVNRRLIEARVPIASAPDVVTEHPYPAATRELLADQYRRGRRRADVRGRTPTTRSLLVGHALLEGPAGIWRAARRGSPVERRQLARATPFVMGGAFATAAGTALGRAQRGSG
jgi:glycosyltransferase involved in cell wall biosynthesis